MTTKTRLTPNAFTTLKSVVSDQEALLWLAGHAEEHPTIVNIAFEAGHQMALKIAEAIDGAKVGGKTGASLTRFAQELRGGVATVPPVDVKAIGAAMIADEQQRAQDMLASAPSNAPQWAIDALKKKAGDLAQTAAAMVVEEVVEETDKTEDGAQSKVAKNDDISAEEIMDFTPAGDAFRAFARTLMDEAEGKK